MRIIKSTLPSSSSGGRVLEERSQTADRMSPIGGSRYNGLF